MIASVIRAAGEKLLHNEPLAKYTAVRLGGPAELLYIAKDSPERLAEVVQTAWLFGVPVLILGGGANVLIHDRGVEGLVVINQVKQVHFGNWHAGRTVSVTSGVGLTTLANQCATRGLSGFEWAVSVPGTIGGAIVNNAGAHGGDMAGNVRDVVMVDADHGAQMLTVEDLAYDYRTSALKSRSDRRFLVLMANLALPTGDPTVIREQMATNIAHRKRTQPPGASLGSIFKNPPGDYAGRLIEAAGLKGTVIGGVAISTVHANFFVNNGAATASDYAALIERVQAEVERQFGVRLAPEIEQIGRRWRSRIR